MDIDTNWVSRLQLNVVATSALPKAQLLQCSLYTPSQVLRNCHLRPLIVTRNNKISSKSDQKQNLCNSR